VAGFYVHSNEPLDVIKCWKVLDWVTAGLWLMELSTCSIHSSCLFGLIENKQYKDKCAGIAECCRCYSRGAHFGSWLRVLVIFQSPSRQIPG
jgi:hypothetical protein